MDARDAWRRVDDVFSRALELSPGERADFVARATEGDPAARAEVLRLLHADARARGFLRGSVEDYFDVPWSRLLAGASEPAEKAGGPVLGDRAGEIVGVYRLVRRIGRGGMASVWLAERADGLFEQRVALKVLRRGLDTDDVVRRFLAERQILSSLSHPNIARVFDGGATEDGLPYFVMELVAGTPIVAWCDARRLGVRERIRLFGDVCKAVQHAHRHLVVHRDLKPSNILVDEAGIVKLLDFGIAKLLASHDPGDATRTGARAMTPSYASPELAAGDRITTASDVYQLGLVLCKLLVGRLPYEVEALSPARAERLLREAAPARPSTLVKAEAAMSRGTSERELARTLAGDLDLIVLQALRTRPEERYSSAEAFAQDLERYRAGEPVTARAASVGYRARKFVARNRSMVTAAAVLFAVLLGSAVTATVQARRVTIERDRALTQEGRARRVTDFLTEMYGVADPNLGGGTEPEAIRLLARGAERALTELDSLPELQASVLSTIGRMYLTRGLKDPAAPLLERSLAIHEATGAPPEERIRDMRALASAVYFHDRQRSTRLLESAIDIAETELGPDHWLLASTLIQATVGDASPAAVEKRERAVAILRAAPDDVREELATALHESALGPGMDKFDRLEEALAIRRGLYGENHTAVAATLNDMALKLERYDPAAADTLLEKAAAINVAIHGPRHHQSLTILNNLAGRYRDRGDYAKAEPLYRRVLETRLEAYPENRAGIAYARHGLGWSLSELGRPEEAEPLLRQVVPVVEPAPGETNTVHQISLSTLGRSIALQGRYSEAEPLLRGSADWFAENAPRHPYRKFVIDRVIALYDDWGRDSLASEYRAQRRTLPVLSREADAGTTG